MVRGGRIVDPPLSFLVLNIKSKINFGVISLGREEVPFPNIVLNLLWTYMKLHCKGQPYRYSGIPLYNTTAFHIIFPFTWLKTYFNLQKKTTYNLTMYCLRCTMLNMFILLVSLIVPWYILLFLSPSTSIYEKLLCNTARVGFFMRVNSCL